jgi:hypothetical protein
MTRQSNAMRHGAYAKDLILPGENLEDFIALLNGLRLELAPQGMMQDENVSEIAELQWKKRRISPLLQSTTAGRVEKERERMNYKHALVELSEALAAFTDELKKKDRSLGKLGANMRYVMGAIEELQPMSAAIAKSLDEAKNVDGADDLETFRIAVELEARLDAQLDKKIQRLVVLKELQRQYGQDASLKLLQHDPSTAHGTATKKTVPKGRGKAWSKESTGAKQSTDANDGWNDNDNDNNNDEINPNDHDWEHEYDESVAEQKKERRARGKND